jgi:hypothetical protein
MISQFNAGLYGSHRKILIVVALVVVLFCSLFVYMFFVADNNLVVDYTGPVHVKTEADLVAVVNGAPSNTPVVIVLGKNVNLTDTLCITDGVNITLSSANKAVFLSLNTQKTVRSATVISVEMGGWLIIDNIIVTGSGVSVDTGGTLVMVNGMISDTYGTGVYNCGVFMLVEGKISDNISKYGGGVNNEGNFTMSGGEISGNYAEYGGGGVYNTGNFTMSGGMITNNKVDSGGGGVYNSGSLHISGGEISDNKMFHAGIVQWITDNIFDATSGTK